jgi:hypothetical protein
VNPRSSNSEAPAARRLSILLGTLALVAAAACGSVSTGTDAAVTPPVDAATSDSTPPDDGPAPVDGPDPVDAATDSATCSWTNVAPCDTGGTIAQFCPTGMHVAQLRRCDGTTYVPDMQYQQFHLCNCQFQTCGCNGVAWSQVECCTN